ncbi:protein of unknown function [Acetitomaculum ruminis DSM 5522]|uniref:DUF4860 domain-containing protein n=1 Tax=Acetitomaculum ruminis DSM 5522 TaxID=1120918 RepID=A0A1I0XPZ9_9FIRM|nr:DUF4860 domain-containing protein [Acetitomaculum ruminis]SFB03209.1 protein of unknown function [Acetitomaculum ruminis DSM 5522]
MMSERNHKHIIEHLFVFVLFGLFASLTFLLVILGANVYKNTVNTMDKDYNVRTLSSYISQKVRRLNVKDGIYLKEKNGISMLVLDEEKGKSIYSTYIYSYSNCVREIVVEKGLDFSPNDGEKILTGQSVDFSLKESGLIEADCIFGDICQKIYINTIN